MQRLIVVTDLDGTHSDSDTYTAHWHALRFCLSTALILRDWVVHHAGAVCRSAFVLGIPVESDYKYDSYRVSFPYLFYESAAWRLRAGATAFVRDAKVELSQAGLTARDSYFGVVPLLSLND